MLTTVKIETVFAYVRMHGGPFALARLVSLGSLRSTDASKLGTASWKRIVEVLPQVLSKDHVEQLRVIVDLGG